MTLSIAYNSDADDKEIYAAECGAISKLTEEMKYRLEDLGVDNSIISNLETMEHQYWNEANDTFYYWNDLVFGDTEKMTTEELKNTILNILPSVTPKMSYDGEQEFISNLVH